MEECIFCKISRGEVPAVKVYEDEDAIAFLDINPVAKGHTLIIPKQHFRTLTDMSKLALANLMAVVFDVATAILKGLGPDGFRLEQRNEKIAGQVVPHVHFHVMPLYENAEKMGKYANRAEMDTYAQKIREAMP